MSFISKTIKYVIVYPVVGTFGVAVMLTIFGPAIHAVSSNEAKVTTSVVIAESKPTESKPTETYKHQQCRLDLHKENPYGGDTLVWDTSAFGTYEDGEVWVGYNRKVGDKVYKNLSKICK